MSLIEWKSTAGHGVKEMEESTGQQADGRRKQEDEDRPFGHVMWVGCLFMQFHCAKGVRIDVMFEFFQVLLKGLEEGTIEGTLKLLHDHRCDFPLKSAFGPFKLS